MTPEPLPLHLFLCGVSCVGKSTIGRLIAQRIGIDFHSLDEHVERFYGKSIERIRAECIGSAGYNNRYADVLNGLLKSLRGAPSVIELPPGGLLYKSGSVVKKAGGVTVALHDTPENLLKRIVFYDIDSKPLDITLTDREKALYLKEFRKDIAYFRTSHSRALFQIDISGTTPEQAAEKVISATGIHRLLGIVLPSSP
jgi:shikimate kinase